MTAKKAFLSVFIIALFLFFATHPSSFISSVSKSLVLWYNSVLPTLFPFAMGTYILTEAGFAEYIGEKLNSIVRLIFNVNGRAAFPLFMGLLAGYPTGAKITSDLFEKRLISKGEAQCILSFCNNAGPIFITATVGASLMNSLHTGYIMLFSTVAATFISGVIFCRIWPHKITDICHKEARPGSVSKPIGTVISSSIYSAAQILVLIGGYMVLSGIINNILEITGIYNSVGKNMSILISGIFEMTTGINTVCKTDMYVYEKAIYSSFFLGFGGIAILLQIFGFIDNVPVNKAVFIFCQFFKAALSALIATVIIIF
ncbi:MAG: hypothetical protein HFE62_02365 [Firmicutes bacterium]|nr:hypothetical protein [Bacillota bacterium]